MLEGKDTPTTLGMLIYNSECNCLELDDYALSCGENIEIRVFGSWIPGQIAVDPGGWYLFTLDHVGIRLHTGLPARFCESHPSGAFTLPAEQIAASHILLVDDDPSLLQALVRTLDLRLPGLHVDTALSAHDALSQIHTQHYDAIVSDIKMPGMDGLGLLAQIQELQPATPTMLITGHGDHDIAIQALRGGAYDYIQKPIERDAFVAALQRAVQTCQLRRQVEEQRRILEQHARTLERLVQQRTHELVEANTTKDKVIGLVTQELKQPLQRLKDIAQFLHQKLEGTDSPAVVQQGFPEIEQSVARIDNLLHELLTTSNIEPRMFILHRQRMNLLELCQRSLEEYTANNKAELTCEYIGLSVEVEMDVEQIHHVILTLLSCASKCTPAAMPLSLTVQQTGHEVLITLRDLETQPDLGSGLYVSRKIVERHGGHLEMQHFPLNRSTIFFMLPRFFDVSQEQLFERPEQALSTHAVWTITYTNF